MRRTPAAAAALATCIGLVGVVLAPTAAAAETAESKALDVPAEAVVSQVLTGAPEAAAIVSEPLGSFPREGDDYLILSTGVADEVVGGILEDFFSTDLGVGGGADGNDLTQLALELAPPATATCLAFDFQFLSEEYPEYVGSDYNDIFTAEQGESSFFLEGDQVISPNNFAYDSEGNFISVNTVLGFQEADGTGMDGTTDPLVAIAPLEKDLQTGNVDLFLSIQDVGDSIYDSAVLLDNFRWLAGENCERTVDTLVDTDGDGLPDVWETEGIDYDQDGTPELDLPALGADPERADIFLEVDWMVDPPTCLAILCWGGKNFAPQTAALQDVVDAFAAAPFDNPDGTTGISLHIDAGSYSPSGTWTGGNAVPWVEELGSFDSSGWYVWSDFDAVKGANFATARRDAFHYVLYIDTYGGSGSSGISRGIPGADLIVSDGPWGADGFTRIQERGTLMHELGHNLDLMHGGIDHSTYQWDPVFESVMNYLYQLVGLPPSAGLDYSTGSPVVEWDRIRFDGGGVGDLGAPPPVEITEGDEDFTPEIAAEYDAVAVDGDGSLVWLGPNVFAAGEPAQTFALEVENPSGMSEDYQVQAFLDGASAGSVNLTVQAGATSEVSLDIDASAVNPGEYELTLVLVSEGLGEVDTLAETVTALDLGDAGVLDSLATDLAQASEAPVPPPGPVLELVGELADGGTVLPFTDIEGNLFLDEILWFAEQGITTGYPDGTYRPLGSVNRDAMAAFLYRYAGEPEFTPPAESPFVDVSPGQQFYKEMAWLADEGISTGWPDGTFRPLTPIKRDAMAAFLYRFAGEPPFSPPASSPFVDVATGQQFFAEMAWLADTGISTGWPDGTFRPLNNIARDAMAAFLFRMDTISS